jgi:hypothetical protein
MGKLIRTPMSALQPICPYNWPKSALLEDQSDSGPAFDSTCIDQSVLVRTLHDYLPFHTLAWRLEGIHPSTSASRF